MSANPTPNPIPIPRDLKRGDIIVLSNGERREFYWYDAVGRVANIAGSNPCWLNPDGRAWANPDNKPFAVKIIRKASKPKKDADAEWLRKFAATTPDATSVEMRRIRKIAKRLERAAQ